MPDLPDRGASTPTPPAQLAAIAGLDGLTYRTLAEDALPPDSPARHRVGWGFISLYTLRT